MCRRKAMYIWHMLTKDDIIFNDKYVTVVSKPYGLQCEPDKNGHPNLVDELRKYLNKTNQPAKVLQPVNRLDRPVGGLTLFAKTPTALRTLNSMQESRDIKKIYTATVEGLLETRKGLLEHFLFKDLLQKRAIIYAERKPDTKPCSLAYSVLEMGADTTMVEIQLYTGRYHQIRAQFAYIGHPIVGDAYYGAQKPYRPNAICLRATMLAFRHPISGEALSLQ